MKNALNSPPFSTQHRAIRKITLTPYLLWQIVLIPLVFVLSIVWLQPYLFQFWRTCILFWSVPLEIPIQPLANASQLGLGWNAEPGAALPSTMTWLVTCMIDLLALVATIKMNGALLPLKYLVRIICVVQFVALIYFLLLPAQFPYTIAGHMLDLTTFGYIMLLATPVLLALGYYGLDFSIWTKFTHTILILFFFIVMIPHQVILHSLILQYGSVLLLPVLYVCFGALFDVLIFVALYSYAASTIGVLGEVPKRSVE